MRLIILPLLILTGAAQAQGFTDDGGPCYSWNGGHKSAGSFSKCGPAWVIAAKPAPVVTPVAAPVITPSPIMAPQMTCAPPPKPVIRKRRPPPPKC